jgi:hypothetical protein
MQQKVVLKKTLQMVRPVAHMVLVVEASRDTAAEVQNTWHQMQEEHPAASKRAAREEHQAHLMARL